jgi:Tol biopolymer transport system component
MRSATFAAALSLVALPLAAQTLPVSVRHPSTDATTAGFTLDQVTSYPFPNELAAAPGGGRIVWALNEAGKRNVWTADAPDYTPRRLTSYEVDDGQELTSLALNASGTYVVYVRGGDHGGNWDGPSPNPLSSPVAPKIQLWSVPTAGGAPILLGDGDEPVIAPDGNRVVFMRDGQPWTVPIDGSSAARKLFSVRGNVGDLQFSPDGRRLAFVANRGDHAFIGLYAGDSTSIMWLAPSTARDGSPRWSPDGARIVFVRRPGSGGPPQPSLGQFPQPWALWVGDATTGMAHRIYESPATLRGSVPSTHGGYNLHWAAGDRIVFMSYLDGWPHLYSILSSGGQPLLLTPGNYMAEHVTMS